MKKAFVLTAAAGFGIAGTAGADTVINFDSFSLEPEESIEFNVDLPASPDEVIGFSFFGLVSDMTPGINGSWAADLQLQIVAPNGTEFIAGGFGLQGNDEPWDFDGSGSGDNGAYFSGHFVNLGLQEGSWSFTFLNTGEPDFADPFFTWSNVRVTLIHGVPAPGALALLGIAGLARNRRRCE